MRSAIWARQTFIAVKAYTTKLAIIPFMPCFARTLAIYVTNAKLSAIWAFKTESVITIVIIIANIAIGEINVTYRAFRRSSYATRARVGNPSIPF